VNAILLAELDNSTEFEDGIDFWAKKAIFDSF
jgi:hypothetical protein